uniref:Uncharacterized protein n=1 Tax=viral metagenome TaxID=1070528 RepID=A0A6H1ZIW1_9ZZZZ
MTIQIPPTTTARKWTFETAIEQIEFCDYEAIGGKLIWNDAFIWLKNCTLTEKDKEIERLSGDLSVNATMMARQCDLAREAEREALSSKREAREKEEKIQAAMEAGKMLKEQRDKAEEEIVALTAELKSLTEAYNNTDWKKRTDEQKEIINNLTVRWGKVIRENAELTAVKDRQNDFINKVEMAYPEFYEHPEEALQDEKGEKK